MKILFDTNVVLDVLLNRESYALDGITLFTAVENKITQGFLCATTIYYLCTKAIGRKPARQAISALLALFSIADVNQKTLVAAIESEFSDFEDAVLYQAGVQVGVDGFVTRNINDFTLAERSIYTPSELCGII